LPDDIDFGLRMRNMYLLDVGDEFAANGSNPNIFL